jgi:hypothetical protein
MSLSPYREPARRTRGASRSQNGVLVVLLLVVVLLTLAVLRRLP